MTRAIAIPGFKVKGGKVVRSDRNLSVRRAPSSKRIAPRQGSKERQSRWGKEVVMYGSTSAGTITAAPTPASSGGRSSQHPPAPPQLDRWPETSKLILLAFSEDVDFANLASQELRDRLDMPAIPLAHEGQHRVIRKEAAP